MYYCCGYKDHSRPPAVSFHICMDAMLPLGTKGNIDPTNYLLNFGTMAINELSPKVIIRVTLKILGIALGRVGLNL